jgi:hypothetical protein
LESRIEVAVEETAHRTVRSVRSDDVQEASRVNAAHASGLVCPVIGVTLKYAQRVYPYVLESQSVGDGNGILEGFGKFCEWDIFEK